MIDNEKVKLMTQIAIYEKNQGRGDLKTANYYKKDFISFNNFKMQLSLTLVLLVVFGIEFSITTMNDFSAVTLNKLIFLGIRYIFIWILFIIFYTINLTKTNKKYYEKFEERIEKYEKMLKALEEMQ